MTAANIQPVTQLQTPIRVLFTDVDDTLTWQGTLPVDTFIALDRLRRAGIKVIPVTGACAGWCDCLIRTWPVDTVIGENGAFWMTRTPQGKIETHYREPEQQRAQNQLRFQHVSAAFQRNFPQIPVTGDQAYRLTDIAFDIGQEVKIERETALAATQWLSEQGLHARLSSIHINAWLGSYSKADTAQAWLDLQPGIALSECAFIGDSPNDESMFAKLTHTVGVANIAPFLPELSVPPRYLCSQPGGHGFAELAEHLVGL